MPRVSHTGQTMNFFYFDESIQERAGFMIGTFVHSETDLTPAVFEAIAAAGLAPGADEFKSGMRMDGCREYAAARESLRELLRGRRIGLVVVPADCRADLGAEALTGLEKIIRANGLTASAHNVYFDQGINISSNAIALFRARVAVPCTFFLNQDSKAVGGGDSSWQTWRLTRWA